MPIPAAAPGLAPHPLDAPCTRILSNGSLTTLVTAAGAGFTQLGWRRITSYAADATLSRDGILVYLRDEDDGRIWSAAAAPIPGSPDHHAIAERPGMLRIERSLHGIEASLEIAVATDADADLRRLRLRNASDRPRRISVTTQVGLVLHHPGAHAGHPGFSKLFVQTRRDGDLLLARRRPRGPEPEPLAAAHALAGPGALEVETDRARFLGRGRSLASPAALDAGVALSGTVGNVLDPIASLRRTVTIAPGDTAEWIAVLAVGADEDEARDRALLCADATRFDAMLDAAAQHASASRAALGLSDGQGCYLEALLGAMLHGAPSLRADEAVFRRVRGQADDLWVFDLPPDRPLVVVEGDASLAAEAATFAAYAASLGIPISVLALGADIAASDVVAVPKPDVEPRFLDSARAHARLVLRDAWPSLALALPADGPPRFRACDPYRGAAVRHGERRLFENGFGGFSEDGREYVIDLPGSGGALPPMPWANVHANPGFGALTTERGAGHTWNRNSREHRITPWSNDPIADPHGEAFWLRDEDAGVFWSPQPGPTSGDGRYQARHGFGASAWLHTSRDLAIETTSLVATDAPVKLTRVRITNRSGAARRLSLFSYARLVLGGVPEEDSRAIVVDAAADGRTLFARNGMAGVFADGVAFASIACDAPAATVSTSADRQRFLGAGGSTASPRALAHDAALDGRSGARLDACFAEQITFEIAAGASVSCVALLGEATSEEEAAALVASFGDPARFDAVREAVRAQWDDVLGAVRVATPSPALDLLVNGWLGYQTLACRIWGRTAYYQSGGAFGFRDQLQDAASLVHHAPEFARAQILLHAAHQFPEGDVLHWWHPPADRGTRTRFADDLLWLPYLTAWYVSVTGDTAVLDEPAGFVTARLLEPGEDEAYLATTPTGTSASVYEHCVLAIERSLRVGEHGIPLMGTGDWNDGMNLVGREGRGESVWMAFFLWDVLRGFEPLARARGDAERAARWSAHRDALSQAIDASAWDGGWYRRAWFDDGTPLGTASGPECRIDVLPQAWAALTGAVSPERTVQAMDAAERELVMPQRGLIRLLRPPFDRMQPSPGYIQGYVPGIRENGGQYTHAAMWMVRATAALGRRDRAFELLEMLLPVHHARTPEEVSRYQVEPYAVVADVYAVEPHVGRGGWTWYTGSSGWMLRVALESILGLRMEDGKRLVLRPCIPNAWPGYTIEYRVPGCGSRYAIRVANPNGSSARVVRVVVDGVEIATVDGAAVVPIARDGARHTVEVAVGA